MDYDNTNSGAAFNNDRKTSPRAPDFRGSLDVEGTDYWVSVWVKVAGSGAKNPGSKFLSFSLQKKDGQVTVTTSDALDGYGEETTSPATTAPLTSPVFPDLPSVPDGDDVPF